MSDKIEHPGWAIKFADDWLCACHGWRIANSPEFAFIFKTEEEAKQVLKEESFTDGQVVVAWEPTIAKLRYEISELKEANTFSPDKVQNIKWSLEGIRSNLDDVIGELRK